MKKALNKNQLEKVYNAKSSGYDKYHGFVTFHFDQKGRKILLDYTVAEGKTVLDAGGGTGSTALLAVEKVGENGKVTILDLSQGMLDISQQRAKKLNLGNRIECIKGDIDQLPFPDNTFDVVLSTYSACPLGDPAASALELLRVVKVGGLLGMAHSVTSRGFIWKPIGNCIEAIAWKFPSISLGCRAVEILPALEKHGYKPVLEKRIGAPFLPFEVFVVKKSNS